MTRWLGSRWTLVVETIGVFLVLATSLAISSSGLGITWDETTYIGFSDSVRGWAAAGAPLDGSSIERAFAYSTYKNPHPPFLKIANAATASILEGSLDFPLSYRFFYHCFVATCVALAYLALRERASLGAALAAVAFVVLQPRLVCEFLIGTTDGATIVLWLLVPLATWRAVTDREESQARWWCVAIVAYAAAVAVKFTAALVAIPLGAYLLSRRDMRALGRLGIAIATGVAFFVVSSPESWHAPLSSIAGYLTYPFQRTSIPISTAYLGRKYDFALPVEYFDVMTFMTFPAVLLAILPTVFLARLDRDDVLVMAIFVVGLWLVLAHLPSTPKHDGVRQFAAVYPWLALLGWRGLVAIGERGRRQVSAVLMATTAAVLLFELRAAHPHERSYYSAFIGGIRGAERLGMEISYDFDPIDRAFLTAIDRKLPPRAKLIVLPYWPDLVRTYQEKGLLRADLQLVDRMEGLKADALITIRRRSKMHDEALLELPALHETRYEGVVLAKLVPVFHPVAESP